jgi:streptomycin 6-kinase
MHQLPSVFDWGKGFEQLEEHFKEKSSPLPKDLVDKAKGLFTELAASQKEQVLLHGDLNHSNILSAEREPWLAIDPKGVIGEREYEIGVLLRNPRPELLHEPDPKKILARRIDQLANELNLDRERIHGWGIAQAVLSAWWIIEDNGNGWEEAIECAEIIRSIKL